MTSSAHTNNWENDWLTYREPTTNNTRLHQAITEGNTAKALKIITLDASAKTSIVNIKALGNTALLLALKRGMFDVAIALINHSKISINEKDTRGLRAIDFACMLRANNIIKLLLNLSGAYGLSNTIQPNILYHGQSNTLSAKALGFKLPVHLASPFQLYVHDLSAFNSQQLFVNYTNSTTAQQDFTQPSDTVNHININNPLQDYYSDMVIFHMKALCINLGLMKETEFPTLINSAAQHQSDMKLGIAAFCNYHDTATLDPEIIMDLANSHAFFKDEKSYEKFESDVKRFCENIMKKQADTKSIPLKQTPAPGTSLSAPVGTLFPATGAGVVKPETAPALVPDKKNPNRSA